MATWYKEPTENLNCSCEKSSLILAPIYTLCAFKKKIYTLCVWRSREVTSSKNHLYFFFFLFCELTLISLLINFVQKNLIFEGYILKKKSIMISKPFFLSDKQFIAKSVSN